MSVAPDNVDTHINALQQAIQDDTRRLEEVQRRRLHAEEEIIQCTGETKRRVDLMMGNSGVVDVLQQLGHLLQEERRLSEELNDQVSANRNQMHDLLEKSECITDKVRHLTADILEVSKCLTEAKTHNMAAARGLIHAPTSKSKRIQNKSKRIKKTNVL